MYKAPCPQLASPPPPGNWYLFLACVGSLLSTAADRLYLASFNELRVADVRLGSTFSCMCAYVWAWHASFLCACAQTECPPHLWLCTNVWQWTGVLIYLGLVCAVCTESLVLGLCTVLMLVVQNGNKSLVHSLVC